MTERLYIEWIGGNCPVQAEGLIEGKRFYFRARGSSWSMDVHPTATGLYESWPQDDKEWVYEEDWGEDCYAAGWMSEETARELIAKGADLFVLHEAKK